MSCFISGGGSLPGLFGPFGRWRTQKKTLGKARFGNDSLGCFWRWLVEVCWILGSEGSVEWRSFTIYWLYNHMAVCQNLVPLVNIKIAGKWMFIPLKMVLMGIDPFPYNHSSLSQMQMGSFWGKHGDSAKEFRPRDSWRTRQSLARCGKRRQSLGHGCHGNLKKIWQF